MFDGKPDGSGSLDPVPRSMTGAAIYLPQWGSLRKPSAAAGEQAAARGASTVGSLPIWMEQVRGWISTRQLWNWHALHCLLTVIFLLDFIKTPSVVRADKESKQKFRARERGRECEWMHVCAGVLLQDVVAFLGGHVWSWRLSFNTISPLSQIFVYWFPLLARPKQFVVQMKLAVCEPAWTWRHWVHAHGWNPIH